MALTKCPACGGQVSTEASACPHCGQPQRAERAPMYSKRTRVFMRVVGVTLIAGGILGFLYSADSVDGRPINAVFVIVAGTVLVAAAGRTGR